MFKNIQHPESAHLLRKEKFTVQFDWFGFDQTCKCLSNSTQAKQLNPSQSNRRSAVQWYFLLQSKWVFSGESITGVLFDWFFLNGPSPAYFLFIFVFSNNHYNFTTTKCEKCPYGSRCRDSNPRPSEHESPPVTTRPGLPPIDWFITYKW